MDSNKKKIIKVKKNSEGDIVSVIMTDGNTYSIEQAIEMVKDYQVDGVNVAKSKSGREYLRSNPNGEEGDNLDNLPTFD